jgi:hypothetical protein
VIETGEELRYRKESGSIGYICPDDAERDEETKEKLLAYLGQNGTPYLIGSIR